MKKFDVEKYLRKNPPLSLSLPEKCRTAVIIPAYDEAKTLPQTIDSFSRALARNKNDTATAIVVINYPPGADAAESEETISRFEKGDFPENVVPVYLPELSGGVGAARKAGMDAFISTVPPEELEKSVICSLDGDTIIAEDYFDRLIPEVLKGGAVSLPFAHQRGENDAIQKAIDRYERYLRRYEEKLKYAGSPYAFFTIGSAFAVRGDSYIRAGGMKVRDAGEDFYFLQAVAKSSQVRQLEGTALVHPSPRVSHRVPFGTGPAVASILAGGELKEIPDGAFEALRKVIDASRDDRNLQINSCFPDNIEPHSRKFFEKEGFVQAWQKILHNLPDRPEKRQKAFHEWFDALKTLKFLHFFSDFP